MFGFAVDLNQAVTVYEWPGITVGEQLLNAVSSFLSPFV